MHEHAINIHRQNPVIGDILKIYSIEIRGH